MSFLLKLRGIIISQYYKKDQQFRFHGLTKTHNANNFVILHRGECVAVIGSFCVVVSQDGVPA
jgi:hypothetical protein